MWQRQAPRSQPTRARTETEMEIEFSHPLPPPPLPQFLCRARPGARDNAAQRSLEKIRTSHAHPLPTFRPTRHQRATQTGAGASESSTRGIITLVVGIAIVLARAQLPGTLVAGLELRLDPTVVPPICQREPRNSPITFNDGETAPHQCSRRSNHGESSAAAQWRCLSRRQLPEASARRANDISRQNKNTRAGARALPRTQREPPGTRAPADRVDSGFRCLPLIPPRVRCALGPVSSPRGARDARRVCACAHGAQRGERAAAAHSTQAPTSEVLLEEDLGVRRHEHEPEHGQGRIPARPLHAADLAQRLGSCRKFYREESLDVASEEKAF